MNIVKSIASIALLSLVVAAPSVRAGADECVIDAIQWGKIFTPDDNAIPAIDAGIKPIQTIFGISVDAGYFGPAFALFELPQFKGPVLFGKLRVDVERAWGYELGEGPDELPVAVYDVNIPLLSKPIWTYEDYYDSKDDLSSGRLYGNFSVFVEESDGTRVEMPLSYDAMFDVNAAAGGVFAIGLTNNTWELGWGSEGAGVHFLNPSDGGIIQLVIPNCKSK